MKKSKIKIIAGQLKGRKIFFQADNHELRPTLNRVRETVFNWLANDILKANCLDLFSGSGIFSFEALSRGAKCSVAIENHLSTYKNILQNKLELKIHQQNAQYMEVINKDVVLALNQSHMLLNILSKNMILNSRQTTSEKTEQIINHTSNQIIGYQLINNPSNQSNLREPSSYALSEQFHPKFNVIFLDPPYHNNHQMLVTCCHLLNNPQLIDHESKIYFESNKDDVILYPHMLPQNFHIIKRSKAGNVYFYLLQVAFN
jgi:16S rRNA G966 N2-methylase RsmD